MLTSQPSLSSTKSINRSDVALHKEHIVTSVHQLPTELLISIWSLSLTTDDTYLLRLLELAQVCRHWAFIIHNTPALWAYVDSSCSSPPPSLALSKSRDCPINVRFHAFWTKRSLESVTTLQPHVHRIRSASLVFSHEEHFQDLVKSSTAQVLEKLEVEVLASTSGASWDSGVFGGIHPKLRHLQLRESTIPWSSSIFFGLQSLIFSQSGRATTSIHQVLTVLEACPKLERLDLLIESLEQPDRGRDDDRRRNFISLPCLNHIRLSIPPGDTLEALKSMQITRCAAFSVTCRFQDRPDNSTEIQNAIRPFLPPIDAFTSRQLTIELSGTEFAMIKYPEARGKAAFELSFSGLPDNRPFLSWVAGSLTPSLLPLRQTKLSVAEGFDSDSPGVLSTLRLIPEVTSVIVFDGCNPSPLLQALSQDPNTNHMTEWMFPHLDSLMISNCQTVPREVLEMIRSRWSWRQRDHRLIGEDFTTEIPPPAPLKELYINDKENDPPEWMIGEVARVLDEAFVHWNKDLTPTAPIVL